MRKMLKVACVTKAIFQIKSKHFKFYSHGPGAGGLLPVILATQEAEIRTMAVRSHPREIVCETLS
jgi:hypothetical protein